MGLGKGNGMSLGIVMRFVHQIKEVTESGSLILSDNSFTEKNRISETMLQNYLAEEDEKKSKDREFMKMWSKCSADHLSL